DPGLVRLPLATEIRRAPILPDEGARHRPAVLARPEHAGLTLIRQTQRRQITALNTGRRQGLGHDRGHGLPDFLSIMLDPARLRIVLRKLARSAADRLPLRVVNDGPRAGCALI